MLGNPTLNGLSYLEVSGHGGSATRPAAPAGAGAALPEGRARPSPSDNILITGGESITGITAAWVATPSTLPATLPFAPPVALTAAAQAYFTGLTDAKDVLVVGTSVAGDFSTYTLSLVNDAATAPQDTFELSAALAASIRS